MSLSTSSYQTYEKNMHFFQTLKAKNEEDLNSPISKGKWSIREIIGHIYYWDLYLLEKMVPEMKENGVLPDFPDHDAYNADAIVSLERFTNTKEQIEEFVITRKKLIYKMEKLDQGIKFTIGNKKRKFTPESFLKMFVNHDLHHIKQIRTRAI